MKKNLFFSLSCLCVLGLFETSIIEVSANKEDTTLTKAQRNLIRQIITKAKNGDLSARSSIEQNKEMFKKHQEAYEDYEKWKKRLTPGSGGINNDQQQDVSRNTGANSHENEGGRTDRRLTFTDIADQTILIGLDRITLRQILNKEIKGVKFNTKEQKEQAKQIITGMITEKNNDGSYKYNDKCNINLTTCGEIIQSIETKDEDEQERGYQQGNTPRPPLLGFNVAGQNLSIIVNGNSVKYKDILGAEQKLKFKNKDERSAALDKIEKEMGEKAVYDKTCTTNFENIKGMVENAEIEEEEERMEEGCVRNTLKEEEEEAKQTKIEEKNGCALKSDQTRVQNDLALYLIERVIGGWKTENMSRAQKIIVAVVVAICKRCQRTIMQIGEENNTINVVDLVDNVALYGNKLFGKECSQEITDDIVIAPLSVSDNVFDKVIEKYSAEGATPEDYAKAAEKSIVSAFEDDKEPILKFADGINLNDDIKTIINKIRETK